MKGSHTKAGFLAFLASIDPGTKLTVWEHNTPLEIKDGIVNTDLSYKLRELNRKNK